MSEESAGNAGHDDWLDSLAAGEPYYLECERGHGSLPPGRVCPEAGCDSTALTRRELPSTGVIESATVVSVPTPAFEADAPFSLAIADFGPVSLTGQLRSADSPEIGSEVTLTLAVPDSPEVDRVVTFSAE